MLQCRDLCKLSHEPISPYLRTVFCREELERLIAGWLAAVQTHNMVNFKDVFSDTYDVTDVFKTAVNNIRLL